MSVTKAYEMKPAVLALNIFNLGIGFMLGYEIRKLNEPKPPTYDRAAVRAELHSSGDAGWGCIGFGDAFRADAGPPGWAFMRDDRSIIVCMQPEEPPLKLKAVWTKVWP